MTGATDVFPNDVPHPARGTGMKGKKFTPRFGLFQSCSEGALAGTPSSPLSLSSPIGGDDDKSSRDVATHNQIRPTTPFFLPPRYSTTCTHPRPALPPTTPDILGREKYGTRTWRTSHRSSISPFLVPRVSRKPTPGIPPASLAALLFSAAS